MAAALPLVQMDHLHAIALERRPRRPASFPADERWHQQQAFREVHAKK
jgi:hypothetical protein